jgi:hypothetical protein
LSDSANAEIGWPLKSDPAVALMSDRRPNNAAQQPRRYCQVNDGDDGYPQVR